MTACCILRVGSVRACVREERREGVADVDVMMGMGGQGWAVLA